MKKFSSIIRIVILSIVAIALIGLLVGEITYRRLSGQLSGDPLPEGAYAVLKQPDIKPRDIDGIQIVWTSGSITLESGDVDQVTVIEAASENAPETIVSVSGRTLKLDYGKNQKWIISGINSRKDLRITVPKNWDFKDLEIISTSADTRIQGLTIQNVNIESVSGESVLTSCDVKTLNLAGTSGSLDYTGTLDKLEAAGTSSNVHVNLTNHPSSLKMISTSGDLRVMIPSDCGFTAECSSISGEFNTNFDTTTRDKLHTFGDGSCRIELGGISSDLFIIKGE